MKKRNRNNSKGWRASAYGVAFLLLMMAGCDNATSPNQDLTSNYDTPVTMQSGDAMNTTIDEQPIYSVPGFYFLAPMVKDSEYSGTFDAGLSPVVEICETTACATIHKSFDMDEDGSEGVRLDEDDEHYIVNWHTDQTGTEVGQTYRIRVSVAGTVLAHADIQMAENGRDAKNITDDEAIVLVDGRTLPIKFRVEEGAVYVTDSGGGTITSEDGLVTLEIPENAIDGTIGITISSAMDELDDEDVIPGTLFDFGPSPFTFNEPVILTITFDPGNLPDGVSEDELRLLAVVDGEWVQLPGSSVDLSNSIVTGPLDSFSRKGVGRGKVSEITVTPADASLEVGGTQQFEAIVTNVDGEEMNRNVRWSSSNEEVVTVDNNGLVTAVALGESTIEARSGKVTGTADLTVEIAGPVVTTITVSPAEATISEGSTSQFAATVYDQNNEVMEDETVTWSSSHESVATVNENGLAAGLNEGETTLIATIGAIYGNAILNVTSSGNDAFVTTWDTSLEWGRIIKLALTGEVNVTVDWGDGTITTENTEGPFHVYDIDGIYTVSVTGSVTAYNSRINGAAVNREPSKLVSVDSWGKVGFISLNNAFYDARNLISVPNDTKGLEAVTDMESMFERAFKFNGDVSNWDTGNVTSMASMFHLARDFNQDISGWNTANVTNMSDMFRGSIFGASAFNQNLNNWDTGNVTTMRRMFQWASAFNGNIGDWNTAKVNDMGSMFSGASTFNQNLDSWDTSNITNMASMFRNASAFNQNLGSWNTGKVIDMSRMFSNARAFNGYINNWDTGNVTTMRRMLEQAWAFDNDISGWNTSNVIDMFGMFNNTRAFNQNLDSWDTGKVTNMGRMFYSALAFNQNLGSWNTGNVTNMNLMFRGAIVFNQYIGNWDTSNVTNMAGMFQSARDFNQDIGGWETSNTTDMNSMFDSARDFNEDIGKWNTGSVTNMGAMFGNASAFNQDIGDWDTSNVRNMGFMFRFASVFNQNLSRWCVSRIPDEPTSFDAGANSWVLDRPIWGSCPG